MNYALTSIITETILNLEFTKKTDVVLLDCNYSTYIRLGGNPWELKENAIYIENSWSRVLYGHYNRPASQQEKNEFKQLMKFASTLEDAFTYANKKGK